MIRLARIRPSVQHLRSIKSSFRSLSSVPLSIPSVREVDSDIIDHAAGLALSRVDEIALGMTNYTPSGFPYITDTCVSVLNTMYIQTGLPWWASIACTALSFRLLLMPLIIKQQRTGAVLANIRPEMESIKARMAVCKKKGDVNGEQAAQLQLQSLMSKNKVNPITMLAPAFLQFPIFIGMFWSTQAIIPLHASMTEGGILWFTDLTQRDEYIALPIISAGLMYTSMQLGRRDMGRMTQEMPHQNLFMTSMCLFSIPFTMGFPSGTFSYWIAMNSIQLIQMGLFRFPQVKRALGIPEVVAKPKAFTNPFTEIFNAFNDSGRDPAEITREQLDGSRLTYSKGKTSPFVAAAEESPAGIKKSPPMPGAVGRKVRRV